VRLAPGLPSSPRRSASWRSAALRQPGDHRQVGWNCPAHDPGAETSERVAHSLQEIVAKVRKVDELIAEVASASREQSQGIDQVAIAVTQMDKITQRNAGSAQESAAHPSSSAPRPRH